MSATSQRDQTCQLAKRDARKALEKALGIADPWFKAQALAWVARYSEDYPVQFAKQAAKAANECDDRYQKTAARAWEIAALAERKFQAEARKSLRAALEQSKCVSPLSSRAEALVLLLQAAIRISHDDAKSVADELIGSCAGESHWRCKRAVRDANQLMNGQLKPRPFFW